ncbi:MAG: CDP-alcohol phosphatidyltransferase family protein [Elusimicrobiota bacterium]
MTNTPRRLQVLLSARPGAALTAGLPCSVRAAFRAGTELTPERIVIAGADEEYLRRWSFQFRAAGVPVTVGRSTDALEADLPLLVLADDAFPDASSLARFLEAAEAMPAARRTLNGRAVAVYARDAAALGAGTAVLADVHARALALAAPDLPAGDFLDASTPDASAASAAVLYARMSKDNDGYLARFDRRFSLAITRLLLPFPVSPNQVTGASLIIGLIGAWWLAAPSVGMQFLGAMTLWFCALLDGCDGEIARLKHHITSWGGEFDLLADHIAHLATFVALPIGVARLHPGINWWPPGVLLVTGFLACGFSVYWLILRVPEERRGPNALVVERIASRDYVYLIVALTAIGRLDWFLWAAAFGSHLFWAWLWLTAAAPAAD